MDMLGYDQKTLERIYYYLEDEGLIKTFALGGKFTITKSALNNKPVILRELLLFGAHHRLEM
jgi:hypothetical protein